MLVALLLMVVISTGQVSVWTLTPLYILLSATVGLTFPNIAALAFERVKERMGSASALQGTIQISLGGIASAMVSAIGNGATLPMVSVTLIFAVLALVFMVLSQRQNIRR